MNEHELYIFWSYAGVALVLAVMVALVAWNSVRVKKRLADLEKAGVHRRSAGAVPK